MTEIDVEKMQVEAKDRATEASKQGTFSLMDRLTNRDYPVEDVEVYLDEAAGYQIGKLIEQIANEKDGDKANVLQDDLAKWRKKAESSRVVIHLRGISSEKYDEIVKDAQEQFPLEYREDRNPLTMKLERELLPSEDRETYFRTHLWAEYIRNATDADGNVDANISPEWVAGFLAHAPLNAQAAVYIAVEKLRMVTDWMDNIQTDDFLVKS